jgi:hypothetical protein
MKVCRMTCHSGRCRGIFAPGNGFVYEPDVVA